jgi:predicted 2-oxoglutarate/Fe(II)-dependent dioxygenase YbiX
MIIKMPRWQSYMATTTQPLFTPQQCQDIINAGHAEKPQVAQVGANKPGGGVDKKKRTTTISWIPFKKLPQMYKVIENQLSLVNLNHFGFQDVHITEPAQFTEYPKGGFYDWHMDLDVHGQHEPPIRKISMTCLLSDPSTFTGGELEFMEKNKIPNLKQGQAIFFASFLRHRVAPVKKGIRRSLVMWFGGQPFK